MEAGGGGEENDENDLFPLRKLVALNFFPFFSHRQCTTKENELAGTVHE